MNQLGWIMNLFRKLDPLKEPLASLEVRMTDAEDELVKQKRGLAKEIREREQAQAEIERSIVAATRDVLRSRPSGRGR